MSNTVKLETGNRVETAQEMAKRHQSEVDAFVEKVSEMSNTVKLETGDRVETAQEMAKRLQSEVDAYAEKVSEINTQEELDDLEKALMEEMDTYDKYIKERVYELPEGCAFEGKNYTRSMIADYIVQFISKIEQTWQYVLGLYELCKFWKDATNKEISFGALDSTLRLLDQCKFQGMTEWRNILTVNEYMKALHEAYAKDTTQQIAYAKMHNEIMKRRDLIDPVIPTETAE